MMERAIVIGAGLAGCEAAWQLAQRGVPVTLHEMKPHAFTPAHHSAGFAELVCSNSLRSDQLTNAVGLLKEEMRQLGSLILKAADATRVPAGGALADTLAFDTGPGNMVIDALAARVTNGALRYDDGGKLARQGQVSAELLRYLVDSDDYLRLAPPKTTGREHYSAAFADALWRKGEELGLTGYDKIATATAFTAESIRLAVEHHCPQKPERLIVGGGGSHNPVLMELLQAGLPGCEVVTNEALGLDSDAKEAVAFAILANEMLHGRCNNAPSATGAAHPVVMGKLSL